MQPNQACQLKKEKLVSNKNSILKLVLLIMTLLIVFLSCTLNNEDSMSTINITLGNKAFKQFKAGTPPSNIESYTINVSGSDISDISATYSSDTQIISLDVPAGDDILIELYVNIDPDSLSAAINFMGSTVVDLATGSTSEIMLDMTLNDTNLVIPDNLNQRLVLLNSMDGDGWIDTDFGVGTFYPNDVDLDNRGRIFIAAELGGSGQILRVDDFADNSPVSIFGQDGQLYSVAVDRNNDLLYFADNNNLFRTDLNGNDPTSLSIDTGIGEIMDINGISVADNGMLYIAGANTMEDYAVFLYNPFTEIVVLMDDSTVLNSPSDTIVKDDFVYITNPDGTDGNKIILYDRTLVLVDSYGIYSTSNPEISGNFYGPSIFIPTLNDKIIIIDEDDGGGGFDKLTTMDDIDGNGWDYIGGVSGTGENEFRFFSDGT